MKRITDREFVYIPAAKTDIRATFKKQGWVGPEQARNEQYENNMRLIESNNRQLQAIIDATNKPRRGKKCASTG